MTRAVTIVAMAALVFACASAGSIPVVQSEYWKEENFAGYERYAWLPSDADRRAKTQAGDHRLHDLIREAIDERLAVRGFTKSPKPDVDFLVTYHCRVAERIHVKVIDRVWYDTGNGIDWEPVTRRVELSSFDEGSIVIDFARAADGKRVWRGVALGSVSRDATPEQLREIVDRSVREILGQFPPPRR